MGSRKIEREKFHLTVACSVRFSKAIKRMKVEIKDIVESNLDDIPETCKGCLYWEFPKDSEKARENDLSKATLEPINKKKNWFIQTMKTFGICGKIVYRNNLPVGYAQYAPSTRLPNIASYKSKAVGRIENGTVFLSCLFIADKSLRGKGIGMKLLDNIVSDLKRRGFRAIETLARRGSANNPSGPVELYLKKGFYIKNEANPDFPLVRLDL